MSESTALIPIDDQQTSLDKFLASTNNTSKDESDLPSLRKLFPSKDNEGVILSSKEKELFETPIFEAFRVRDDDTYSNDIGQPLNLYEQVQMEQTDDILLNVVKHYNRLEKLDVMEDHGIIHNIPEYYRRDLYHLDKMLNIKGKLFEAYSFKSDERRYGKVLRVITDATREDLQYLAHSYGKHIINRRIDLANAGKTITVGGVMYPTKLIRRFKRGENTAAFQLDQKDSEDGSERPPLLCVEVYGGTLIIQGMWRPYYKTHEDGEAAAA